jgi:hypothetical protein
MTTTLHHQTHIYIATLLHRSSINPNLHFPSLQTGYDEQVVTVGISPGARVGHGIGAGCIFHRDRGAYQDELVEGRVGQSDRCVVVNCYRGHPFSLSFYTYI